MDTIHIQTFEPGEFDSWVGITVGDRELDVHYDHDKPRRTEILEQGNEIDFPAEERDAIMDKIELFFSFYDKAGLQAEKRRLTEEALGAMGEHIDHNRPVLTEDTVVTVHRQYLLRQHQTYELTLKAGERMPRSEDWDWEFDERVCNQGTFISEEVELIDNDELELEITGQRPASAPEWTAPDA